MSWEEIGKQVTVIGAVIAAITGSLNLWLQMRGKYDRFVVRMGGLSPSTEPETLMHVFSLSDHPIKLTDWGFIENDGGFQSARISAHLLHFIRLCQFLKLKELRELPTFGAMSIAP